MLAWFLSSAAIAYTVPLEKGGNASLADISYIDETGNLQTVTSENAKLIAVHLWATWCVPCLAELPEVDAVAKRYKERGFKVMAISLDMKHQTVEKFFATHHISTLPSYLDHRMSSFRAVSDSALPYTVFFDGNGNSIAYAAGPLDWKAKETVDFIEAHANPLPRK